MSLKYEQHEPKNTILWVCVPAFFLNNTLFFLTWFVIAMHFTLKPELREEENKYVPSSK